jgi:hypothetical protein
MHFIVNTNLQREGGYYALIEQLERQGVGYTLVRKPPFADYLVAMEDDFDADGHQKPIMLEGIDGPVFVTGTTSMKAVSEAHGWQPGYIDAPSQDECFAAWDTHMLNRDAVFGTIADIVPPEGEFFIRPDLDSKAFSGTTMHASAFEDWRRDIMTIDTWTTVPRDLRVMIAPLKTIWAEYRCIMVRGRYVTGSRYKTGETVAYSPDVGDRIIRYANERVAEWCPRVAMCLDIADTPEGLKVIETNAISSAGFYSIDMNIFVGEIAALGEYS